MNCFRHYDVRAENGEVFYSLMYGKRKGMDVVGMFI